MAGKEFKTKRGAKLYVSHAAFEDGLALAKAVNKCMLDRKLFGVLGMETTLRLFGDPEVYAYYEKCAEKATYNDRRITSDLFDDPKLGEQASADLLEIFDTVVAYNNSRFFPVASSASSGQPQAV